ncbi:MAG: GGDEF domain-containing protein [Treponema sp.]|jgi:diguanylate cyclase (GGDEF)-like protein|nr:GGDEF domain-containing protein [Treponema sp.]
MIRHFNSLIKRKVLIFSMCFFLFIIISGGITFFRVIRQVNSTQSIKELMQFAENKQRCLENRLSREIELTVKLADSPLIRRFFRNPDDPTLRALGMEEILSYGKAFSSGVVSWANEVERRYYEGDTCLATYDPENSYHQWYPVVRDQKEPFSLNINYDYLLGHTSYLYINAPVRDLGTEGGQGIGAVSNRIGLDAFLSFLYTADYASIANTELYLFNRKGEITGAPDPSLVAGKIVSVSAASDGARMLERTLLSDRFKKSGTKILSEIPRLETDPFFCFIENNTQYAIIPIASLDWYMLLVRSLDLSLFFSHLISSIFIGIIGLILVIFVIFNVYIFMLLNPLLILTGIMNTILSTIPNPLAVIDKHDRVIYVGKALCDLTRRKGPQDCERRPILDLFDNEDMRAMIRNAIQQSGHFETTTKVLIHEKRRFFKIMTDDINGAIAGKFIFITDITASTLDGLIDPLTGLANRRNFDTCLQDEWKRAIRDRQPISFLMMDLDKFKDYNDTYGHPQGDQLLKAVASIFAASAKRPADLAVRMGGEEFALLLPNTELTGALYIAERIRLEVEKTEVPLINGNGLSSITISIGIACTIPTIQDTVENLVSCADQYLYEAKLQGRNRVAYPPSSIVPQQNNQVDGVPLFDNLD